MTEIPDQPFDKITMDLVTDFTESNKGNKHILTIIDLLMGWPEAIPIHHQSIHQTLLTQTPVPPVHTIRQWHRIQESDLRQSHEGSWHREGILCTIPPSK